ncbi:hypothetical protein HYPDE_35898 [Hyphomicrobium denitrificans 1NES1]|uniref:Uncharacterized protein n=1 Tax=Hyphomicrobium denitrificans 1NES1 TaxID=670307 RepID=N0BEA8_9HYPH|nr:hypothetical protein HYPDE_35898 [Hyphomicrobium denitrificans 1NES1]
MYMALNPLLNKNATPANARSAVGRTIPRRFALTRPKQRPDSGTPETGQGQICGFAPGLATCTATLMCD